MVIEARKIAELTQKQSAELVCVDERTWQRWESGDRNMSRGIYKLYLIETKQILYYRVTIDTRKRIFYDIQVPHIHGVKPIANNN